MYNELERIWKEAVGFCPRFVGRHENSNQEGACWSLSFKPGNCGVPVAAGDDTVRYGTIRYGKVRYGPVRYGPVRSGPVR